MHHPRACARLTPQLLTCIMNFVFQPFGRVFFFVTLHSTTTFLSPTHIITKHYPVIMSFWKHSIPCVKSSKFNHQAVLEEPSSPHTLKDKSDSPYSVQQQPSPARSSSSSSSGSYDLEDAMPEPPQENFKTTTQSSAAEQELDVSCLFINYCSCYWREGNFFTLFFRVLRI